MMTPRVDRVPPEEDGEDVLDPVDCTLDLNVPWGLLIGDDLFVQQVQDGSQAEGQGIANGWKVLAIDGQKVPSIHMLKSTLSSRRGNGSNKNGSSIVKLTFMPCEDDEEDE